MNKKLLKCCIIAGLSFSVLQVSATEVFPDGTPIPEWFRNNEIKPVHELGKSYCITDYGVINDSTVVQTEKIQAVIDKVSQEGGGVIHIPQGTFLSGSLFFKPNTHLKKERSPSNLPKSSKSCIRSLIRVFSSRFRHRRLSEQASSLFR